MRGVRPWRKKEAALRPPLFTHPSFFFFLAVCAVVGGFP
jgi:hypothetical protein